MLDVVGRMGDAARISAARILPQSASPSELHVEPAINLADVRSLGARAANLTRRARKLY